MNRPAADPGMTPMSRRRFLARGGTLAGAALMGQVLPAEVLRRLGAQALGPAAAHASSGFVPSVVLDTANPLANFSKEGSQPFTAGPAVLALNDGSGSDLISFYASEPVAALGTTLDVVANFQVVTTNPARADTGVGAVINTGVAKSVQGRCIIKDGQHGIGIPASSDYTDPLAYPIFVQVDWASPVSFRLRRTAAGDGQIVEVNGVPLVPPPTLPAAQLAPRARDFPTVEFGCLSVEAAAAANWTSFRSEVELVPAAQVQPPIDADGSSTFNAQRGIVPLKFALTENGSPTCNLPPATLRLTRLGGVSPGPIDESLYTGSADSGTDFRIADCLYHYNLAVRPLGTGAYVAEILVDGAALGEARFELK